FAFIPFFVSLESFKQLWRIRMIDADNRHRFGRFDLDATKIPGDITCDRVKQHRTNVVRRRLKEVAEQQKVVLNVSEPSGAGNELQDRRKPADQLEVLIRIGRSDSLL